MRRASPKRGWSRDGSMVTEGASSTAFIINARNEIVTYGPVERDPAGRHTRSLRAGAG